MNKEIVGSERNKIIGSERNRITGSERNKIIDFGEKIGGAKKDLWKKRGLEVADLMEMNELELEKHIKKSNVWKTPDYQKLLDSGHGIRATYFIKMIKDAAPTKPVLTYSDNTPEKIKAKQEGYVKFLNDLKEAAMNIKTDEDVFNFYEDHIKPYTIKNGRYIEITEDAYDCLDNKLLKAVQVRSFYNIDREISKKQFLYTDEQKILSNFTILKNDSSVEFTRDHHNRTVMNIKIPGGTMYLYPKGEFAEPINWESDQHFIVKGREIYAFNIKNEKDALEYILDNEQLEKRENKTNRKERFTPPQFEYLKFKGPDYKKGMNITGQNYVDIFAFKGGEFGNWLNEIERQESLNYGYEALMSLSDALEIDPESISLNGSLSIAFGSRGSGSAVAHYEPERQVINLTKMKGAGSLAHEWGHAIDDILNKQLTKNDLRDNNTKHKLRDELINKLKYKHLDIGSAKINKQETIKKKEDVIFSYIKRQIPDSELDQAGIAKRDQLINNVLDDDTITLGNYVKHGNNYLTAGSIEELSQFKKDITNRKISLNDSKEINYYIYSLNEYKKSEVKKEKVKTEFYKNAIIIDNIFQKESKGYWQSDDELYARAFACYVADRAQEKGIACDYLTGHAEAVVVPYKDDIVRGFPVGEEREEINNAFDKLIYKYKELELLKERTQQEIILTTKEPQQLTLDSLIQSYQEKRVDIERSPKVQLSPGREER